MLSSSGFRDALGERDLRFDRESGQVYERLLLRPELAAYESALRRRVGRLSSLEDPRLVPLEALEHDPVTGRVTVVSRHASGLRLKEILRTAREHEIVPDLTVAVYLTTEVLLAAHSFQSLAGLPHGAITPEHVMVSAEGEVLLADYAYSEVLEAARFTPARLWREFGVAAWLGGPFSFAGDVRQCALVGIALMLGRPLAHDAADHLESLLSEVEEAAMIRGGRLFADPVVGWLRRAIAAGSPDGFEAAEDAAQECAALLTDRERSAAPAAFVQFLAELDAPPVAVVDPPVEAEPSAASFVSEGETFTAPLLDEPFTPEFVPVTEPEGVTDFTLPSLDDYQSDAVSAPDAYSEVTSGPRAGESSEAPERRPEPVVAAAGADWATPPNPAIEVSPDAGPRVVSPSPFAVAAKAVSRGAGSASALTDEPAPPPVVPVLPPPSIQPIVPPIAAPAAPAARASEPAPAVAAPAPAAPIRLKSDTTIRLKNPPAPTRRSHSSVGLELTDRTEVEDAGEEAVGGGWSVPWKYVAAAMVVLVAGVAAATMDWGSSTPVEASRPTKPVEVPPPPPRTTGSIEVMSNTPGSKVLVDGKVRGETPLTIDDLKPGRHIVVVRAANGNVRRTVTVKAGETAKLDLAVYSGWIVVNAPIELQVLENGKVIGTAGEGPIVLTAGHHTIEVASKTLDYRASHPVDIQPGEEKRLDLNPKGLANLNAVPWAEVWLDGAKLGDTPLGNVSVALGTREFIFKNPQFGERKVSTTITGGAPSQISVDFTK